MQGAEVDKQSTRLEQELNRVVGQLRALGARRIILFGSLARGRPRLGSDLDLLAIFEDGLTFKERMRYVYTHLDADVDVDVLAYNREEFERLKHRSFFRRILREGKVVYEA
ncbi:MAG TPA: nucleotidyltransferase domain-containing protein [Chloroflexi bacterium]|nr:nucleotidyltransferase domain-containing protein [Chloroflexota bacterium]